MRNRIWRSQKSISSISRCFLPTAYCLLPSAYCLLPTVLRHSIINRLGEAAVDVDVYFVSAARPIAWQGQVTLYFVLERFGDVINCLDLFVARAFDFDRLPNEPYARAGFGVIEVDNTEDGPIAGKKTHYGFSRATVVASRHVHLRNENFTVTRTRGRRAS